VTTPSKKSPFGVYVFHDGNNDMSVGVEFDEKSRAVTGALAVCSPRDQFSRKRARQILEARLEKKRFNLMTFPLGDFSGDEGDFKGDVFEPIVDYVKMIGYSVAPTSGSPRRNRRALLRVFINGIQSVATPSAKVDAV
jgi:hypothetical protein